MAWGLRAISHPRGLHYKGACSLHQFFAFRPRDRKGRRALAEARRFMNSRASGGRRLNCTPMVGLFTSRQSNQVTPRRQAPSLLASKLGTLRFLIDRRCALVARPFCLAVALFEISLFSLCYIQLVLSASQAANGCAATTYLQRLTFGAACGVHLGRPRMLEHRQLSHFRNFWARPRPAKIPPLRQLPSDRYCGSRKRGRRLLVQWHEQRSARS